MEARFSSVVTEYPQYELLAAKLDQDGGWKALASKLGLPLSTIVELERTSSSISPTVSLLNRWKSGRDATMEVLIKSLEDINTHSAQDTTHLLQSWMNTNRSNDNSQHGISQITQKLGTLMNNNDNDLRTDAIKNALGSNTNANTSSSEPEPYTTQIKLFVAYCHDATESWALLRSKAPKFKKIEALACPPGDTLEYEFTGSAEYLMKKSNLTLAIITKGALALPSFMHVLQKALEFSTKIVLVHHVKSCKFPGGNEQPDSVKPLFQNIAVSLVDGFEEECWRRILGMTLQDHEATEDIRTDAFLSHKQDTAQGLATTFYSQLTARGFKVFLDVQTKFVLHDLKALVSQTSLFVFILSPGIFDSYWCFCEFEAAVQSNRKIFVVKPTDFEMPKLDALPNKFEWSRFKQFFLPARLKDYSALYLEHFVAKMAKHIIKAKNVHQPAHSV